MLLSVMQIRLNQRSAFTFCEEIIPSCIDFGKSKYGGPFTTEQVEDVKTFFKIVRIALIICVPHIIKFDSSPFEKCILSAFSLEVYDYNNALRHC